MGFGERAERGDGRREAAKAGNSEELARGIQSRTASAAAAVSVVAFNAASVEKC